MKGSFSKSYHLHVQRKRRPLLSHISVITRKHLSPSISPEFFLISRLQRRAVSIFNTSVWPRRSLSHDCIENHSFACKLIPEPNFLKPRGQVGLATWNKTREYLSPCSPLGLKWVLQWNKNYIQHFLQNTGAWRDKNNTWAGWQGSRSRLGQRRRRTFDHKRCLRTTY